MLSFYQLITSDTAKQTGSFCCSMYLQRHMIFQLTHLPSRVAHSPPCLVARLVSSGNLGRELKPRAELAATPVQVELFGGLPVVDEDIIISESELVIKTYFTLLLK